MDIPSGYQPDDGATHLQWRIYQPSGTGPWPTVLVVHGGGWDTSDFYDVAVEGISADLAASGFYTLAVDYRLAPCGRIICQPAHDNSATGIATGRPPQQTNDMESLIRAARSDMTHCNGTVMIVASSSGASLAMYALFDTHVDTSTYPYWDGSVDRPTCVVSLSGVYDLSDQLPGDAMNDPDFQDTVENYTDTTDRSLQYDDSPLSLLTYSSFRPLFHINALGDQIVPPRQYNDLQCALISIGAPTADYILYQITNVSDPHYRTHGFGLWNAEIQSTTVSPPYEIYTHQVSYFVLQFLHAQSSSP